MTMHTAHAVGDAGILASEILTKTDGIPALAILVIAGIITAGYPLVRSSWMELSVNRVFMLTLFLVWPVSVAFEAALVFILLAALFHYSWPRWMFWSSLLSGLAAASLLRLSLNYLPGLLPAVRPVGYVLLVLPLVIVSDILIPHSLTASGGPSLRTRTARMIVLYIANIVLGLISLILVTRFSDAGAVLTAVAITGFSLVGRAMDRRYRANREKVGALTEQSELANGLMSVELPADFLDLLELNLSDPGTDDLMILTRFLQDDEWIAWMASGQVTLKPENIPVDLPASYGSISDTVIEGREGIAAALSEDGSLFLFASGTAAARIEGISKTLRDNLLLLIRQTWEAMGHSMKSERSFLAAAVLLARLADSKDNYTHGHALRVSKLSCALGEEMGISAGAMRTLRVGAILHDLGKLAIPADILTKRGLLTRKEREIIENHPSEGARIVSGLSGFDQVTKIIRSHHERLDGSGYPDGLAGRRIPFLARIVAVADTFDAITSTRTYHTITGRDTAMETIRTGRGVEYDARVVDALERVVSLEEGSAS